MSASIKSPARPDELSEPEGPKSSLSSRAFWLMLAKSVAFCFSFTLPLLLTRRLSQTEYGFYKGAFQIVYTAIVIPHVGFGISAYYFIPRERLHQQGAVISNILLIYCAAGLLAVTLLWVFPNLLVYLIGGEVGPALMPYAPLVGGVILCWVGSSFLEVVAVANQESHLATAFIVSAQLTKTGFLFLAALWFGSIHALLWAAIIQGVVQATVLQIYLRSRFGFYWRNVNWHMMRTQLNYALPIGFAGILSLAIADMHNYFVLRRFTAAEVAIYGVGCFIFPLAGIITDSVSAILLPRLSYLQKNNASDEIMATIRSAMRKLAMLYFPLTVFLLIMGRQIIEFLFTKRYLSSWPVFAVTALGLPFLIFVADPILRAYAETRYFMLMVRAAMVVLIFFGLWLSTSFLGYVGAAVAVVSAQVIERLIMTRRAWRALGGSWRDFVPLADLSKIAAAALLATAVAELTAICFHDLRPFFVLFLSGLTFSISYVACLLSLRVPSAEEHQFMTSTLGRVESAFRRFVFGRAVEDGQ